jgi:hypothetical protein
MSSVIPVTRIPTHSNHGENHRIMIIKAGCMYNAPSVIFLPRVISGIFWPKQNMVPMMFTDRYSRILSLINWEAKKTVEKAVNFTYDESCIKCHQNLFPMQLSRDGQQAHLYYNQNKDDLSCLNCHLHVGHYSEIVQKGIEFGVEREVRDIYTQPARVDSFEDFTEAIPGTAISFDMIAIPGGTFSMGSPQDESGRNDDEGPVREVQISPFFMARIETSWEEFLAFIMPLHRQGGRIMCMPPAMVRLMVLPDRHPHGVCLIRVGAWEGVLP